MAYASLCSKVASESLRNIPGRLLVTRGIVGGAFGWLRLLFEPDLAGARGAFGWLRLRFEPELAGARGRLIRARPRP